MNRRDWMITAIAAIGLPAEASSATAPLPLGLYLPSTDHLSHALMNGGQFQAGAPQFFSAFEFAVIRRIAGLILGEGAPGDASEDAAAWIDLRVWYSAPEREASLHLDPLHHALAVGYYGAASVREAESYDPQKISGEGLAWLAEKGNFLSLDTAGQIAILDSISDARSDKYIENAGTRFFGFIKSEVIKGFYTSRTGLKELDFKGNGFYASSPGCKKASN